MNRIKQIMRYDLVGVILPLVVLFILLITTSKGFLTPYNITSILQQISIFVLIGMAQMFVLSLGQFNLALGSMGCLSAIIMGFLMQVVGLPVIAAVIIGLIAAAFFGWIQGALIARSGINPFIITLALISVFFGISAVITKGQPYDELPDGIQLINQLKVGPVPVTFLISLAVCAIVYFVFRYMSIGKQLLAVGENQHAALFSGINVKQTITVGHMLSGLLCGIAGVIQIARFGSAQISIGDDWMLTSFVVAVLGGTLLSGGKISVLGTLLGSFLMMFINNLLVLWNVNTYMFQAILGLVLLGAFEMDRARISMIRRQTDLPLAILKEEKTHD